MSEQPPLTVAESAVMTHELYTSYLEAGFNSEQALQLVRDMITMQAPREGSS